MTIYLFANGLVDSSGGGFELTGNLLDVSIGEVGTDNIKRFVAFLVVTHLMLPLGKARDDLAGTELSGNRVYTHRSAPLSL